MHQHYDLSKFTYQGAMTQKLWVINSASKIKINDPGIMRLATADNSVMTIRVITF